jgi:hypothetical protein
VAEGRGERHLAVVLVVVPVAGRAAGLDRPEPVDRAGLEEHRLDQRCLARGAVTDDGNVADLSGLDRHLAGLLLGFVGAVDLIAASCPGTWFGDMARDPVAGHILCGRGLVGEGGRLPDLPAVVSGL